MASWPAYPYTFQVWDRSYSGWRGEEEFEINSWSCGNVERRRMSRRCTGTVWPMPSKEILSERIFEHMTDQRRKLLKFKKRTCTSRRYNLTYTIEHLKINFYYTDSIRKSWRIDKNVPCWSHLDCSPSIDTDLTNFSVWLLLSDSLQKLNQCRNRGELRSMSKTGLKWTEL